MPSVIYKGHAHPYRENQIPRLSDAHRSGQYVRVVCTRCRLRRNFRPLDIMKLLEDRHVLALQRSFRCEKCGRKDAMEVSFETVMGSEISNFAVRELVEIRMVKRPVWRDIKL
jgi:hypothetical protein